MMELNEGYKEDACMTWIVSWFLYKAEQTLEW